MYCKSLQFLCFKWTIIINSCDVEECDIRLADCLEFVNEILIDHRFDLDFYCSQMAQDVNKFSLL